jgi:hypothetical protein
MSDAAFASTADLTSFDVSKHVNFTLGMVLGVDDFKQEFAYLSGRTRWLARDAIGYGTLCGLAVTIDPVVDANKGPRVIVTAGTAILPNGQLVCVKPNQCAYLNGWLAANPTELDGFASPANLSLALVLCYRECAVDPVAVPGEPCRVESELTAPSRVADSFSLELRTKPPAQQEEDLLRELVDWLRLIPVSNAGPFSTPDDVAQALRNAVRTIDSPLGPPIESIHIDSAPPPALKVDAAHWEDAFQSALRVWITEIRPTVHAICPGGRGCGSGQTSTMDEEPDDCLLLAELDIPIVQTGSVWQVNEKKPIGKREKRRPLLAPLRLQQEWLRNLR